jgi:hypothetical protein
MAELAEVIAGGDLRASLIAIRDRLADEVADARRAVHKRECTCVCGIGDARVVVAVVKELRVVLTAIDALPDAERKSKSDDLAARRARRLAGTADSQSS